MLNPAPQIRKVIVQRASYRVLLVEDCLQDADFNLRALERVGMEVHSERVETKAQLKEALETKTWDFILSDFHLLELDGLAALELYRGSGLDIPFIIVSGLIGEEQAVKLIKAGAHEYVTKDHLEKLPGAVRRELQAAEERLIRKRTQATEAFLASIVRDCTEAIFGQTLDRRVVSWNAAAQKLYGYTPSEILGGSSTILELPFRPSHETEVLEALRSGGAVTQLETVHMRKNRTRVEVSLTISPVRERDGRVIGVSTVVKDMTAAKQKENERLILIQDLTAALACMDSESPRDAVRPIQ